MKRVTNDGKETDEGTNVVRRAAYSVLMMTYALTINNHPRPLANTQLLWEEGGIKLK